MSLKQMREQVKSGTDPEILRCLEDLVLNDVQLDEDSSRVLIPECINLLQHNDISFRAKAMAVLAAQLRDQNQYMVYHVDELGRAMSASQLLDLKQGSGSGGDDDTTTTKAYVELHTQLIYAVTELQRRFPGKVMPYFKPLAVYLMACTGSAHLPIATAACQHWAEINIPAPVPPKYMEQWTHAVYPKLAKLVPNLMNAMKYHEEHVNYLEAKVRSEGTTFRPQTASKELEQYVGRRNYAAQAFENIANLFGPEIIPAFKMNLIKRTKSDSWLELEASFLALGAFTAALGTPKEMQDVYSDVIPRLLESYNHPKALVRSITCFTMQHFVNTPKLKNVKNPFVRMMKSTLNLILDESLEVQEMALRSLATMLAYSDADMTNFSSKIHDTLVRANSRIGGESRYAYYECIGHFVGQFGANMDETACTELLKPLTDAFDTLPWDNMAASSGENTVMLCQPLLVCAMFCKDKFAAYNTLIMDKATPYMQRTAGLPTVGSDPTTSHMVSVLDIISAIFDNQPETGKYVSMYSLDKCVLAVLKNQAFEETVHQSAMALMGHMMKSSYDQMSSLIDDVVRVANRLLGSKSDTVKNNTLWTLYVISRCIEEKNEALFAMVNDVTANILNLKGDQGVIINSALVLTTLAAKWPDVFIRVCARDDIFTHLFALMQTDFPQDNAHVDIFLNLCDIYKEHVDKVRPDLWVHFCVAAIRLPFNHPQLNTCIKRLLKDVRSAVGSAHWGKINEKMGKTMSTNLRKKFKLY